MYSWVDGRKNSGSRNLPTLNFVTKSSVTLIRNGFEVNNFNRLPVIKEEEVYLSDDDVERSQTFSESNSLVPSYESQKTIPEDESSNSVKNPEKFKEIKSHTKLPPLVNVNCMMNPVIKQTRSIWDTKFGKRLIYGRNDDKDSSITEVKKVRSDCFKSSSESFDESKSHKPVPKRKAVRVRSEKSARGERRDLAEVIKCGIAKKEKQNTSNKKSEELLKTVSLDTMGKSGEKLSEISSEALGCTVSATSSVTKSQRFLTECVQGILEGRTNEITCEHCNETFESVLELCSHKKQHENEKETCLLCKKVFFKPNEFIQHLLTHEGVDRFSCKKCKMYFPSLKKYKKHCLELHFVPQKGANKELQSEAENAKKWQPKFECRRCKMEFDSEKKFETHRRNHMKKDLAAAYLLTSKTL